jgi:hypothetical protein
MSKMTTEEIAMADKLYAMCTEVLNGKKWEYHSFNIADYQSFAKSDPTMTADIISRICGRGTKSVKKMTKTELESVEAMMKKINSAGLTLSGFAVAFPIVMGKFAIYKKAKQPVGDDWLKNAQLPVFYCLPSMGGWALPEFSVGYDGYQDEFAIKIEQTADMKAKSKKVLLIARGGTEIATKWTVFLELCKVFEEKTATRGATWMFIALKMNSEKVTFMAAFEASKKDDIYAYKATYSVPELKFSVAVDIGATFPAKGGKVEAGAPAATNINT